MSQNQIYERWIAQRRNLKVADELADRVMGKLALQDSAVRKTDAAVLRLLMAIDRSRIGRRILCCAALMIGVVPFVYLASLAVAP